VPRDWTIAQLCRIEDHIIGGFPVLHLVPQDSVFERHLLEQGPAIF
jgi:hypothetical protein